ncbi:MAG: hypothetical protein V3U92_01925 [Cellulophaga sp.]
MASVKNLKKDINFVLGDIIEAVYTWEVTSKNENSKDGNAIIDSAISTFDDLIAKVNKKGVENKKSHLKEVRVDLEKQATTLIEKLNKLG